MRRPSGASDEGETSSAEQHAGRDGSGVLASPAGAVQQVAAFRTGLSDLDLGGLSDGQRLDLLHQIELLTRSLAAVSATAQVLFHASQVAAQVEAGVAPSRAGRAVPDDLAAARLCSPYWGSRDLTAARGLCQYLPRTLEALRAGVISPYQARLVAEGTTCVDPAQRAEIDERRGTRLAGISHRELEAAVRGLVYEVDPAGFVARARSAAQDRGVSVRPAPDVMSLLTARLPAPRAIAMYQSLDAAARARRASGDPRTVDQLRADELFERATGRQVVDVSTSRSVCHGRRCALRRHQRPRRAHGYGPVPADHARGLLRPGADDGGPGGAGEHPSLRSTAVEQCPAGERCTDWDCSALHGHPTAGTSDRPSSQGGIQGTRPGAVAAGRRAARVWVRRLYTDPVTGVLTRRDPRRRFFTDSLRALVVARDRTCRNPWCGGPIRTVDHLRRHADGPTDVDNAQGLCERCNLARERPRLLRPGPRHYLPAPPLLPILPRPRPRGRPGGGGGDRGDTDGRDPGDSEHPRA